MNPSSDAAFPPDRSHLLTEQRNPHTSQLHRLNVKDLVNLIHREDQAAFDAVTNAEIALCHFIEAIEPRFIEGGRLIYAGAGTSGRLGVLDASEAPPTFQVNPGRIVGLIAGGDPALRRSSEGREDEPNGAESDLRALNLTPLDTLLGIAAGGTTPYVLGAISLARRLQPGCLTALMTCSPVSKPADADHLIVLATGPEVLTGSTRMKAGTATKMALNLISTTLMVRSGRVYENLMVDLKASNDKLRDRAARILSTLTGLDRAGAFDLLKRAGGEVKRALVMHKKQVDPAAADSLLRQHHDRLGDWLDAPSA